MNSTRKIAIIDSGIGGISVLNKLIRDYHYGNFVFIADNAYMPFGEKTIDDLLNRIKYLKRLAETKYNCSQIILACNTASVVARLDPNLDGIHKLSFNDKGLYLTTTLTSKCLSNKDVIDLGNLASQIESNIFDFNKMDDIVKDIVKKYSLFKYKKIILACTHFELVRALFEKYCNKSVVIDNSENLIRDIQIEKSNSLKIKIVLTKRNRAYKKLIKKLVEF